MQNRSRLQALTFLEAGLIGIFFVQALRLLVGLLYSRFASASLVTALNPADIDFAFSSIVEPATFSSELGFLVYMLALPLLTLLLGRVRWLIVVGVALAAIGRALMSGDTAITTTVSASMVIGGALLYLAMLVRYRARVLPYFFVIGFGADQVFRAFGDTLDPSWSSSYFGVQLILSLLTLALSFFTTFQENRLAQQAEVSPERGLLPIWGGIGLGALLFLELALLALPNAVAGRASTDYTTFVPILLVATLLPLIPWVRVQARNFIGTFDGGLRGWLWMLLIALLMVFGTRFQGILAGVALALAQFTVSLLWWWLVRPQGERERSFTGLWLVLAAGLLGLFVIGDSFTYEYAFVRGIQSGAEEIDQWVTSLLRGFRGMGLGLLLLAVFLAALPMTQVRRRIPWTGGSSLQNMFGLIVIIATAASAGYAARPPVIAGVRNEPTLRFGTYNIHAGYNEFFSYELENIARTINFSGANIVLLQEVEAGRLTSFGVDQSLWLARRLGMDKRFYPATEGLQGLAVLSNVEIVFHEGKPLASSGPQTGLQRVQLRPDSGIVTVYNTWLGLLLETGEDTEMQEQDQQRQLNQMIATIAGDHPDGELGRMIVGGTFNNVPTSPLIQQMRDNRFSDAFDGQPRELSHTLWRTGQRARLDYLFLSPRMRKVSAGVMETNASDHRMAVVEVEIAQLLGG